MIVSLPFRRRCFCSPPRGGRLFPSSWEITVVLDHSGTVPDSTAGFSLFARFPVPPVCFFSATGATSFLLRQGAPPVSLFRFWSISFFSPLLFRLIPP